MVDVDSGQVTEFVSERIELQDGADEHGYELVHWWCFTSEKIVSLLDPKCHPRQ